MTIKNEELEVFNAMEEIKQIQSRLAMALDNRHPNLQPRGRITSIHDLYEVGVKGRIVAWQ